MAQTKPKFMLVEHGRYYYQRKVPQEFRPTVGRSKWRASLGGQFDEANDKLRSLRAEHDELLRKLRNPGLFQKHKTQSRREKEHSETEKRVEGQKSVMPPHQQKRLEEVQRHAVLARARIYGHRLHSSIVKRIVEGLILDPEVLCSIGGGVNELPATPEGWDDRMKDAAENESLAQICVDARNAELKEQLCKEELSNLKPDEKIKMARARTLDPHLEQAVQARLEARRL